MKLALIWMGYEWGIRRVILQLVMKQLIIQRMDRKLTSIDS